MFNVDSPAISSGILPSSPRCTRCSLKCFDEWMGLRDIGNRFELLNFEDAKVGLPPMRLEDRIIVRAQHLRSG